MNVPLRLSLRSRQWSLVTDLDPVPISAADRAFALAWGVMLTLCVTGYTFGQSNHHVYLLDALHIEEPASLARDWFTTHTYQYHFLFTRLVIALQHVRLLQAGFFVLYVGLAIGLHAAWLAIVNKIGGGLRSYLLSTLLYHLSAGGLGLGVYQFLQDGSFLPSNISAVATLAAVAFWLDRRLWPTALCVGVAGLFHVNYAMALVGFWGLLSLLRLRDEPKPDRRALIRYVLATIVAMTPCAYNVTVAAIGALSQTAKVPLEEFVAVYVRLRHEHHHDPLHWPIALWVSFLWPLPLAFVVMRQLPQTIAVRRLNFLFLVVLAMQAFAVVFAGIWFVSDTIVQLSFFRFSMFAKLISCVYAALFLIRGLSARGLIALLAAIAAGLLMIVPFLSSFPRSIPAPYPGLLIGAALLSVFLIVRIAWPRHETAWRIAIVLSLPLCLTFAARQELGVAMPGEDDAQMVEVARWARISTPEQSLFLTPPHDAIFSLEAHRSSVVGFKQVPQLSGEFLEWKRRLDDVLDEDITNLPRPLPRTMDAMADRYASLSPAHLETVAEEFGCEYIVAMREQNRPAEFISSGRKYFVYRR